MSTRVGILHPGRMGASVGAAAKGAATVAWASEGRGEDTRRRAEAAGLSDLGTVGAICRECDVVISVCPPAAAESVAEAVAGHGFDGLFVDANAVSPGTALRVRDAVERAGARFVDGGIIGPPAHRPGTTRLYLSGAEAGSVAALFRGSPMDPVLLDGGPGAASALKMSYAAWTKGSAALLLAVRALAMETGVQEALLAEWALSIPDLAERSDAVSRRDGPKAWRFAGEMREIATTFEAAELPDGFHRAAAEVFGRLAGLKDRDPPPGIEQTVEALRNAGGGSR